jgi:HAD superfamily hydrolase (TIGR01509 family)
MTRPDDRGLFLDFDGTLADSLGLLKEVYFRFMFDVGRRGSEEEFDELNGPSLSECIAIIRKRHRLTQDPSVLNARLARMMDHAYLEVSPADGAPEILAAARQASWRRVIVTSGSGRRVRAWLERYALATEIDVIVGDEDVVRGKPHPDAYLKALARARCAAATSVAVEDSPNGARAAVAAGIRTFVVNAGDRPAQDWPPVAGFVAGLSELVPDLLAAK